MNRARSWSPWLSILPSMLLLLGIGCGGGGGGGPAPVPGSSLQFDGTDDFVNVPAPYSVNALTIEAWVKPLSLIPTGNNQGIVGRFESASLYLPTDTNGDWGFQVCTPGCAGVLSGATKLVIGEWQHLAGVYDGSTLRTYRNGELIISVPQGGFTTDMPDLDIGRLVGFGHFHGLIDEVRLWRVDRTQAEIQANMSRILTGGEADLLGYWRFEEGTGQSAADSSSGGNAGVLGSSAGVDAADPAWVVDGPPLF